MCEKILFNYIVENEASFVLGLLNAGSNIFAKNKYEESTFFVAAKHNNIKGLDYHYWRMLWMQNFMQKMESDQKMYFTLIFESFGFANVTRINHC